MLESLHPRVLLVVGDYLDLVDDRLPGVVQGLYLVGSIALDDFRAGTSAVERFPDRWEPTVRACLRVRREAAGQRSRLPTAQARDAVNFMDFVIGDANRLSIRS